MYQCGVHSYSLLHIDLRASGAASSISFLRQINEEVNDRPVDVPFDTKDILLRRNLLFLVLHYERYSPVSKS